MDNLNKYVEYVSDYGSVMEYLYFRINYVYYLDFLTLVYFIEKFLEMIFGTIKRGASIPGT